MNKLFAEDTIAALATPSGKGAISVVRVSGPEAIYSVDKIFRGRKKLIEVDSHTIHYGNIESKDQNLIDDVLISVFREPNSFTGENAVEISTHGNPLITQKIVELLLFENVRLAEPGEFTKRAFLNNRIDLVQAEAVADVISARTEVALRGSRNQLDGLLSQKVNELRELLINASSFVELELDFAEDGSPAAPAGEAPASGSSRCLPRAEYEAASVYPCRHRAGAPGPVPADGPAPVARRRFLPARRITATALLALSGKRRTPHRPRRLPDRLSTSESPRVTHRPRVPPVSLRPAIHRPSPACACPGLRRQRDPLCGSTPALRWERRSDEDPSPKRATAP